MKQAQNPSFSGQQLVADFQSVLLSRATTQAAIAEAERSETNLMQQLNDASRGNFLNPSSLEGIDGDYVVRASVDAHIKKAQAEQLQTMTDTQISQLIFEDQHNYQGVKVRITSLDADFGPFDAVWFDQQTGYRTSIYKKLTIEGTIEEIVFDKNMLLIKPKRLIRLINNSLQSYVVYVINPKTLKPAVDVAFI